MKSFRAKMATKLGERVGSMKTQLSWRCHTLGEDSSELALFAHSCDSTVSLLALATAFKTTPVYISPRSALTTLKVYPLSIGDDVNVSANMACCTAAETVGSRV